MTSYTVGLIPAPGMPRTLIEKIIDELPELTEKYIDADCIFKFELEVSPLASSAEYINETIHRMAKIKKKNDWDYVIGITDLPSLSENRVVVSEFDSQKSVSLISLPALGFFSVKRKLRRMVTHHMEYLYKYNEDSMSFSSRELSSPTVMNISRETPIEDNESTNRYIIKSYIIGWLKIILGMAYINEPWSIVTNFKTLVSLAFATGTYIAIFSTPWELSIDYQPWRLFLLMIFAVIGMVFWLIYAHKLWGKSSTKTAVHYRWLYNLTTFMTLLFVTIANYVILFILLTISVTMFVPPEIFNDWTQADEDFTVMNYINLIWFTTSLGILAGALGSTAESEEKIRSVTYSYRQLYRYQELQKEDDESEENKKEEA
ncbi:hypothetical protein BN1048_01466 [Jeotgalicoccus saudimassiliensis]|uniref:5,10-methylene-tetrahydrofolate dehydrogenase n=1 Tax=Jeotgalicoccus saudimassiliensis TaxID=1461582 RepID=A0A078M2T2_9STAP|nr:hypothetical protein [Jeotgalicoccus saudimassiliensis]CEA01718.1 hypothetical protein BN1048_01466 [Jeotgalicoccus saudimassiliensis]